MREERLKNIREFVARVHEDVARRNKGFNEQNQIKHDCDHTFLLSVIDTQSAEIERLKGDVSSLAETIAAINPMMRRAEAERDRLEGAQAVVDKQKAEIEALTQACRAAEYEEGERVALKQEITKLRSALERICFMVDQRKTLAEWIKHIQEIAREALKR